MSNMNPGYNTRSAKKKSMGADSPLDMNDDENERMNDFIKTRSRAAAAAASSASECNGGFDVDMDEGGLAGMKEEKIGSPIRESSAEGAGNRNSHARPGDVGEAVEPMTGSTQSGRGNPLHKLTVKLLHTYQEINEKYYAKHKPHCNDGFDDENGDYIIRTGEVINDRFEIANRPGGRSPLLGKGSFGQVVYALDRTCDPPSEVALKIIRNHSHWAEQAKCEIELLRRFTRIAGKFGDQDWVDHASVVRLIDDFVYRNHCCLVFELLPFTLYDLLKYSRFKGVSLTLVRKFAHNLIRTLDCLRQPNVDVIHCDLKPENVMLVKYNEHRVKVIDFGSSCSSQRQPFTYIQSRFYRAPEVLLCRPYSYAIDMWSLGCILVEMHTGQPLFNGKNELMQMCKICDVLGMPPRHMIEKAGPQSKVRAVFRGGENGAEYELWIDDKRVEQIPSRNFKRIIRRPMPQQHTAEEAAAYDQFENLLLKMLAFDPEQRITPAEALRHSFFATRKDPFFTSNRPKKLECYCLPYQSHDRSLCTIRKDELATSKGPNAPESEDKGQSSAGAARSCKVDQEVQTGEPSFLASQKR